MGFRVTIDGSGPMSLTEEFLSSDGIGQFMVAIRQKKGKPNMIAMERGYISA